MPWFTKCPNVIEICFLIFLHFLSTTERLSNRITTLTVIIWNEDFILISTPFFLTFSWISTFPDPYQNVLTLSCLFKIFTFPDFFLTCGNPSSDLVYQQINTSQDFIELFYWRYAFSHHWDMTVSQFHIPVLCHKVSLARTYLVLP